MDYLYEPHSLYTSALYQQQQQQHQPFYLNPGPHQYHQANNYFGQLTSPSYMMESALSSSYQDSLSSACSSLNNSLGNNNNNNNKVAPTVTPPISSSSASSVSSESSFSSFKNSANPPTFQPYLSSPISQYGSANVYYPFNQTASFHSNSYLTPPPPPQHNISNLVNTSSSNEESLQLCSTPSSCRNSKTSNSSKESASHSPIRNRTQNLPKPNEKRPTPLFITPSLMSIEGNFKSD